MCLQQVSDFGFDGRGPENKGQREQLSSKRVRAGAGRRGQLQAAASRQPDPRPTSKE